MNNYCISLSKAQSAILRFTNEWNAKKFPINGQEIHTLQMCGIFLQIFKWKAGILRNV